MNNPIHTWRRWRVSDALDRGDDPRRAGVFDERDTGLDRFRAGLRELDRRLSDPARTPIMDAPAGLGERVMREVESRGVRPFRADGGREARGFVFGSWQRMMGVALAAGLAFAAVNWPDRASRPLFFEDEPPAAAVGARSTPPPELALAGAGQTVVRLILGGPSAAVPTPIAPTVLEGTREMGERAVAALERMGQERHQAEPARRDESSGGKSHRRPGEPELKSKDVLPGVMLAVHVVSRLT